MILRRDKDKEKGTGNISGVEMVKKIPEIINNGEIVETNERIGFILNGYRVSVRPNYNGEKVTWVITAMEKEKNSLSSVGVIRSDQLLHLKASPFQKLKRLFSIVLYTIICILSIFF
jgi:hypothetical protein